MLTLVNPTTIASYSQLFEQFLVTLKHQLFTFDNDIFDVSVNNLIISFIRFITSFLLIMLLVVIVRMKKS